MGRLPENPFDPKALHAPSRVRPCPCGEDSSARFPVDPHRSRQRIKNFRRAFREMVAKVGWKSRQRLDPAPHVGGPTWDISCTSRANPTTSDNGGAGPRSAGGHNKAGVPGDTWVPGSCRKYVPGFRPTSVRADQRGREFITLGRHSFEALPKILDVCRLRWGSTGNVQRIFLRRATPVDPC